MLRDQRQNEILVNEAVVGEIEAPEFDGALERENALAELLYLRIAREELRHPLRPVDVDSAEVVVADHIVLGGDGENGARDLRLRVLEGSEDAVLGRERLGSAVGAAEMTR